MPRGKHPPKKKHENRVRAAAITPLSADLRRQKARDEIIKALVHMHEAEISAAWGQVPNACAHSAYYAMHHAASAAILAAGGVGKYADAPPSHQHVIEHYSKLVAGEAGPLGISGMALRSAYEERLVADYDLVRNVSAAGAQEVVTAARLMLDAIRQKWRLGDDAPPEGNP